MTTDLLKEPEPEEKATSAHLCENWKETDDYCYLCAPKGWAEPEDREESEIGDLHVIGDDHTEVSISGYVERQDDG